MAAVYCFSAWLFLCYHSGLDSLSGYGVNSSVFVVVLRGLWGVKIVPPERFCWLLSPGNFVSVIVDDAYSNHHHCMGMVCDSSDAWLGGFNRVLLEGSPFLLSFRPCE